jgi:hypothetical protein
MKRKPTPPANVSPASNFIDSLDPNILCPDGYNNDPDYPIENWMN